MINLQYSAQVSHQLPHFELFQTPFSFDGRMRRAEFVISVLISLTILFGAFIIAALAESAIVLYFIWIPTGLFLITIGSKRSHDIGNSGWFQFIPFYFIYLFFVDGDAGDNLFGCDPKYRVNPNPLAKFKR